MSDDEQQRQIHMAVTLARMEERDLASCDKLDRLITLGESHTAILMRHDADIGTLKTGSAVHAEKLGNLEALKVKVLAGIGLIATGGGAIGHKVASLFGSGTPPTPPGHP